MHAQSQKITLAEHLQELRRRLMWAVAFIVVGAVAGYFIHDTLVSIMQRPLHDTLYYTAPTGAFSFIIKVCTVFGFLVALPVIIYQAFAFFGPLIVNSTKRTFVFYITCSFLLAIAGVLFAYFLSLPAALNFLVNFGDSSNIESLITANEYFNFVLVYITGFALIFQLPLVVSFINRISPLRPVKMLKATRYVILGSFIAAAIITPTPDPLNQFLMAAPVIVLYLASVAAVALKTGIKRPAAAPAAVTTRNVQIAATPVMTAKKAERPAKQRRLISDFTAPSGFRPTRQEQPELFKDTVAGRLPRLKTPVYQNRLISDFYNPAAQGR